MSLRKTLAQQVKIQKLMKDIIFYILHHAKHNRYIVWHPFLTDMNEIQYVTPDQHFIIASLFFSINF